MSSPEIFVIRAFNPRPEGSQPVVSTTGFEEHKAPPAWAVRRMGAYFKDIRPLKKRNEPS